jgi:hypothetical protein
MSFLPTFKAEYYDLLKKPVRKVIRDRADGFLKIFELLEEMNLNYYKILETGTMGEKYGNLWDDGCSTLLFDRFLDFHKGLCLSVDIDKDSVEYSKTKTKNTDFINMDSVDVLWNIPEEDKFDLIYLDSYGFTLQKSHESRLHQMKELCAVIKNTRKGTIIASDDFVLPDVQILGKGEYVEDFLINIGAKLIYRGYQLIYQL